MKRTTISILVLAILAGCGGGGESHPQKVIEVKVDDPNAPAKTSADLTAGKHIESSTQPTYVSVPSSSMGVTAGPETMTVKADSPITAKVDTTQTATSTSPQYVDEYVTTCDSNNVCTRKSKSPDPGPQYPEGFQPGRPKQWCDPGAYNGVLHEGCPMVYTPVQPNVHE